MKHMQAQKDVRSVVIHNMLRDSDVQLANTNVKIAISLVISIACATRRESLRIKVFGVKGFTQSTSTTDWYSLHARFNMWPVR